MQTAMYVQIAYLCEIIQWILVMKIGIKPMTFKVKIVHKIYMYICMCMFIYLDISMSISRYSNFNINYVSIYYLEKETGRGKINRLCIYAYI